ncbi:MAG: hypothetical protein Q7Q71_05320 [Verrucomicrobiota bacterium JB023]|nr:hypothetical protein [Verrucomicrobiota bacterium JB023]
MMNRPPYLLLAGLALLLGAGGVVFIQAKLQEPKVWESSAVLDVSYQGEDDEREQWRKGEELYLESPEVLDVAIEKLALEEQWSSSREEARTRLQAAMTAEWGNDLLILSVRENDSALTQRIAATLADTYLTLRNAQQVAEAEAELQRLEAEIAAQREVVEKKKDVLDALTKMLYQEEGGGLFDEPEEDSSSERLID